MTPNYVKQFDPLAGYLAQKAAIDAAIARVTASGWYLIGNELSNFEREFAAFCGSGYAIGVANGTDAIEMALRATGVGEGDYVLTTALTAVATATGIVRAGAKPVFVDIDPDTCNISPSALEDTIKACHLRSIYPKATLLVHLYGRPAELDAISDISSRYDLLLVEDCAQSHGAQFRGRRVGSFGASAAFSFYPTKNLGTLGDAGAVVSSNDEVVSSVRRMRQYGWNEQRVSEGFGFNSRMDEFHAAILSAKLVNLEASNQRRREIASAYTYALSSCPTFVLPKTVGDVDPVFHQFVVRVQNRSAVQAELRDCGVGTAIHYAKAVHEHPFFQTFRQYALQLTESERASREVLSLPMYPELSDQEVSLVVAACRGLRASSAGIAN